ncbi:MAG: ChbG/HpnK family deacetylase [Candidatus Latescibacteria bacterium]|nr:ChbG/HpnK family deacetylase [Candidatus Latescibacterota bacterium]
MVISTGKILRIAVLLCILSFILSVAAPAAEEQEIRLIVRGDDFGMTQGSLVAFEEAFNNGVLTCGAIQAPAPWFEGAAELCRKNPGWCVGIHLCVIGEWRGYRWRPVLPWDEVSSIVDEDGFLYRYPEELFAHNPKIEEIDAEFRAQVDLALKYGVNAQYIDTHYMGYSSYPGLEEVFKKIGRDYDLPISAMMDEKRFPGIYNAPEEQKTEIVVKQLEELEPGLWLWVNHIGIDSPEQNALIHTRPDHIFRGGGVGKHRAAELKALTSIEVKSMILIKGIKLVNYRELWEEKKKR